MISKHVWTGLGLSNTVHPRCHLEYCILIDHIYNFYNILLKLFTIDTFFSALGRNRLNTTKYALKRPKLPSKRPKTYKNPYPHCRNPILYPYPHFYILSLIHKMWIKKCFLTPPLHKKAKLIFKLYNCPIWLDNLNPIQL